jgi:hypothetical protein
LLKQFMINASTWVSMHSTISFVELGDNEMVLSKYFTIEFI